MRILLDGLCALGLLSWSEGAYSLTPNRGGVSRSREARLLRPDVPRRPPSLGSLHRQRPDRPGPDRLRVGRRNRALGGIRRLHLLTWPADVDAYRARWSAIGVTAASMPGARVLDVGCGSAIASLVLALDDPTATVTGIDRGPVVEVAGRIAEAMGVASRASFVAGDVTALRRPRRPLRYRLPGLRPPLPRPDRDRLDAAPGPSPSRPFRADRHPRGPADTRRVRRPGARTSTAVWLFNVARRGRLYTLEEYAAMLAEAGFGPVRRLEGTPWLQAEVGS